MGDSTGKRPVAMSDKQVAEWELDDAASIVTEAASSRARPRNSTLEKAEEFLESLAGKPPEERNLHHRKLFGACLFVIVVFMLGYVGFKKAQSSAARDIEGMSLQLVER